PRDVYARSDEVKHAFNPVSWDGGGRYVLIKHQYGKDFEWIVLDTENAANSKNITALLDIKLEDLKFYGNSGRIFYGLSSGNIRKLDIGAKTISATIVSKVTKFTIRDPGVIGFVGVDPSNSKTNVAGIYRDGDESVYIIKRTSGTSPLNIAI